HGVPDDARADRVVGRTGADAGAALGPLMDTSAFRAWVHEAARLITEHAEELTRLDAAIGDGDHGVNLRRGFQAADEMLDKAEPEPPGAVLQTVGRALISKTGGASGPLYGTAFRQAGKSLGDATRIDAATLGS